MTSLEWFNPFYATTGLHHRGIENVANERIDYKQYSKKVEEVTIKNVIFNPPATIVFWSNGDKTVVKCDESELFDPEKGMVMAISKHALGNKGNYYNEFVKYALKYNKNKIINEKGINCGMVFIGDYIIKTPSRGFITCTAKTFNQIFKKEYV